MPLFHNICLACVRQSGIPHEQILYLFSVNKNTSSGERCYLSSTQIKQSHSSVKKLLLEAALMAQQFRCYLWHSHPTLECGLTLDFSTSIQLPAHSLGKALENGRVLGPLPAKCKILMTYSIWLPISNVDHFNNLRNESEDAKSPFTLPFKYTHKKMFYSRYLL